MSIISAMSLHELQALRGALGRLEQALTESKSVAGQRPTRVRQAYLDLSFPRSEVDLGAGPRAWGQLESVRDDYLAAMAQEFDRAEAADPTAVLGRMSDLMFATFTRARELGVRSTGFQLPLEGRDQSVLGEAVREEMHFLGGFLEQFLNDELKMPFDQRLDMYGRTIDSIFHAGAVASLPTQAIIHWRLGIAEHCRDCIYLSSISPFTKPGQGANPLTVVPRAGDTKCKSNCKCSLVYEVGPVTMSAAPRVEMDIKQISGRRLRVSDLAKAETVRLKKQIDTLYQRMTYFRQMAEITEGKERSAYLRRRADANEQLIQLLDRNKVTAVPAASVDEILAPVRAAVEANLTLARDATLRPGMPVRVLEGLDVHVGSVLRTSRGEARVRLPGGQIRGFGLDDRDDAIVFLLP